MTKPMSRRDFLKLAGAGAATSAVLTGCGPASRYVTREPYTRMPEYTYNGESTYFATTCRECSAGCGLVVRTMQGRAIKVEGNKNNPVNMGKTCARGQVTLQGLYNPDRIKNPGKHTRGSNTWSSSEGSGFQEITWLEAVNTVSSAISDNEPDEIAFLLGMSPDHLFDLVTELTKTIGAPPPVRFGALGMFEARNTLLRACERVLGTAALPFFDMGEADVVFSFGANFLETWLSPVAQTREFARFRQRNPGGRGYTVQFEARMSQTAAKADEWIPSKPGSEAQLVLAIGRLVAEMRGVSVPRVFAGADVEAAVSAADVSVEAIEHVAQLFAEAQRPLAIPGGAALAQAAGLDVAHAVLALNALVGSVGRPGGVFLSAVAPLADESQAPASLREMQAFIDRLNSGKVKVLFIHGVNAVFELPASLGFDEALAQVPQVVSFATFPDETALQADYVFPDHHGLEAWGYQKVATGTKVPVLSGSQPVVVPMYNTKSTVDVLLAAAALPRGRAGGALAKALDFPDELAFIQGKLASLMSDASGYFTAPEINTFTAYFQQNGGWWGTQDQRITPEASGALDGALNPAEPAYDGDGGFHFIPFVSPVLGEAGANKPWLQEVPDPTTTVMWNTWVEINPVTAEELGIEDQDVVRVVSPEGSVEATVYKYPGIRPDTVAMPFGQGHRVFGRFAAMRGANPTDLLGTRLNAAGDLAFGSMKVRIEKTGRKRELARLEGALGVYGFDAK
jgi:anaerobic selenocysteine-containing dehydrogenase